VERRRILLEDARGADRHLRVTWHPEAGQCNVSTWHGDVCSGAVRLRPEDVARLVGALADGMADALAASSPGAEDDVPLPPHRPRWRVWLARGLHRARRAA
jgi:hypothetical protein